MLDSASTNVLLAVLWKRIRIRIVCILEPIPASRSCTLPASHDVDAYFMFHYLWEKVIAFSVSL